MEPARSDKLARAPRAAVEGRDGWRQGPQPSSAYPALARWPWTFPTGSRTVPVVGPTEALPARAGGPAVAVPSDAVPSDAVPGLPDPAQRSSWQLSQDVWQESGVAWERTGPELTGVDPAAGWLADGAPARITRATYATPAADLRPPEPADFEPAYAEPRYADSAYAEPRYADSAYAEPRYADSACAEPRYADSAYAEPRYADSAYAEPRYADSACAEPRYADSAYAGSAYPEPVYTGSPDADPAYFEPSCLEPADSEPAESEPPDSEAATASAGVAQRDVEDGELAGDFEQAAPDDWADGWSADRPGLHATDPDGFEAVADEEFGEPGAAETWFTGVGPADARFADAGPARPGPAWDEYPPDGFPGQAWPADAGRVPLGAPVAFDAQAPESVSLADPFSAAEPDRGAPGWAAGMPLSEPDELFRAWQGSVNEAAAGRGRWSVPRRAAAASRRRRALQAAAIGVPVVVIVTVGAGALMMLTGKANDMLAVRADTGAASPAATASGTSGTHAAARPTAGAIPPAFVRASLSGYPGQRGTVTVASMTTAAGITMAVGTADGHPAIWRRGETGSWTLESAATLSAVAGSAGLAAVTDGPAGWIAVGTTSAGNSTVPVVLVSADGVAWQPVSSLTAQAGTGTEFLGAAAGRSGYVVVGRQMAGGRTFAVLWYSADLRSWTSEGNDGLDGRLAASTVNAVTATADGFVAVGSHGADQSIWVSSDGRQWGLGSVPPPAGAASATLSSVAANGATVVAGGYAATRAGDIPVVVTSADDGGQWRQAVLPAPDGLGLVTALTAAPRGFTAAGIVGRSGAQHAVTWTSPDGLTWSAATPAPGTEITALALTGTTVAGATEQGATPALVPLPAP